VSPPPSICSARAAPRCSRRTLRWRSTPPEGVRAPGRTCAWAAMPGRGRQRALDRGRRAVRRAPCADSPRGFARGPPGGGGRAASAEMGGRRRWGNLTAFQTPNAQRVFARGTGAGYSAPNSTAAGGRPADPPAAARVDRAGPRGRPGVQVVVPLMVACGPVTGALRLALPVRVSASKVGSVRAGVRATRRRRRVLQRLRSRRPAALRRRARLPSQSAAGPPLPSPDVRTGGRRRGRGDLEESLPVGSCRRNGVYGRRARGEDEAVRRAK
jgi:hypothetical protein